MDGNLLAGIAGVVLSLVMEYVPPFRAWYDGLEEWQPAVMGVLLVLAAVGVFSLSCYTSQAAVTCDEAGFWELARMLIYALTANQATYLIAVKPRSE